MSCRYDGEVAVTSPPSDLGHVEDPMNFLILGSGPEEWAWAQALLAHPEHRLIAACPGFPELPDLPGGRDLDGALAMMGVEAVLVGGDDELRAEGLRRAAGTGLPAICLHPPGPDADPYYQVALSKQETGAVVVPDLPARLHPGVDELRRALAEGGPGRRRSIRYEVAVGPGGGENALLESAFPRVVDAVRALLGEVEAITATGDPPGPRPTEGLVVHLRGPGERRGEVRLWVGSPEPARLVVSWADGSITFEHDPALLGPSRVVRRAAGREDAVTDLDPWDPKAAMLAAFAAAVAGRPAHPDLLDGTRAMELAAAAGRSLRRGRTIDLHYEEISEAGNFKSVMTSTGCLLLLSILVVLPLALAGPALGLPWTIYLAWAFPPLLVLFTMLQLFRFAVRR